MAETGLRYRQVSKHVAVLHLEGDYSVRESLGLVRECLADPRIALPVSLLFDVRRSTTARSNDELQLIAQTLSSRACRIGKIAVVTKSKLHYGLARVLMAFMDDSGIPWDLSFDYETTLRRMQVTAPPKSLS